MNAPEVHTVWVEDRQGATLPLSKGLIAISLTAIGLPPERANELARRVDAEVRRLRRPRIFAEDVTEIAAAVLTEHEGRATADRYRAWRLAKRAPHSLVVVLGGAAGVGKSTLAAGLAARLGVTRVVPTDTVREIMRTFVPPTLLPELHRSSFEAPSQVSSPGRLSELERVVASFHRQATAVSTGIDAVVRRCIAEREDVIVEGVHMLPGLFGTEELGAPVDPVCAQFLLVIDDPEVHRSHFLARLENQHGRDPDRYLKRFDVIRHLQGLMCEAADRLGVPVVDVTDFDGALQGIAEQVVAEVTRRVARDT